MGKAMKAMKKKAVSKIAKGKFRKVLAYRGTKEKTIGGLTKSDLVKNKHGKIVSKKASLRAKNNSAWTTAVVKARKALGLKGFVAIKKGSAQGVGMSTPLERCSFAWSVLLRVPLMKDVTH